MKKNIDSSSNRFQQGSIPNLFRYNALAIALLIIFGILVYSNTFHNPFVFDDINFITLNNPHLHMRQLSWAGIEEAAFEAQPGDRFLPKISLALNYYFGAENPFGFHIVNLAIHILTCILLFGFLQTTLKIPGAGIGRLVSLPQDLAKRTWTTIFICFSAALIWLAHPIQTNAVTYMCQRMASMVAMFYLLSLLAYARGRTSWACGSRKKAAAYFFLCLVAGACAVASKENSGMLPVFILLYEWFFFQDLRNLATIRILPWLVVGCIVFIVIAVMYIGINPIQFIQSSYTAREFTLSQRVMTEFRVVAYYLSLMAFPFPSRLHLDHDYPLSYSLIHPPSTLMDMIMIIALFAVAGYAAKKERIISFCIFWVLGNLVIESSIFGIEIIFEHRMYLPSMMLCFMAALLVFKLFRSPWQAGGVLAAFSILLAVWAYQRNAIWQSDVSFWTDNAIKSPEKARPYQNLAFSNQLQGNFKAAIDNYRKSIRIKPHPVAYFNLGLALEKEKNYLDAVESFLEALKMGYNTADVHSNLAQTLANMGEFEDAVMHFKLALKFDPADRAIRSNLDKLMGFLNICKNPLNCVQAMISQKPDNITLYYKLGILNEKEGDVQGAESAYKKVLEKAGPQNQKLYSLTLNRLGMIYAAVGDIESALILFKKGANLGIDAPYFCYQIAAVYAGLNDEQSAIAWLDKAIGLGFSDWAQVQNDKRWDGIRQKPSYKALERRFK